jgi:parvulin-like peptidyl-prolyl isomerase
MTRFILAAITFIWASLPAFAQTPAEEAVSPINDAVIAKVGDEPISFTQINTMLNSSAVVGLSVPALGTPERQQVRIVLLDKVISANLLYLDALKKGVDKDPVYLREMQQFSDGVLTSLYEKRELLGDIQVSDDEIQAFVKESMPPGTKLTDENRPAIEAALHKKKLTALRATLRERLRESVPVTLEQDKLNPDEDALRMDSDVVARMGAQSLTWAETKPALLAASEAASMTGGHLDPVTARVEAMNKFIDARLMAQKGKAAGLERDPVYQARFDEYHKTHLINFHRSRLLAGMEPGAAEIEAYFAENKDRLTVPEARKIQMAVLKTREEAEEIKNKIQSGELTLYQAAKDYSIDPRAPQTLGEMGWVTKGTGFPELDKLTFSLGPDEIGGPVESPAGWHLVKVLDIREVQFDDIADENTRKLTRRTILQEKLNQYVVNLRRNDFKVVVYEDRLKQLAKEEAEWIAGLEKKAQQPGSLTQKRTEGYQKLLKEPAGSAVSP